MWHPINEHDKQYLANGKSEQSKIEHSLFYGENRVYSTDHAEAIQHKHFSLIKHFTGHGPVATAVRNHLAALKYLKSIAPKKAVAVGDERVFNDVDKTTDFQYEQFLRDFSLFGDVGDWVKFMKEEYDDRTFGTPYSAVDNAFITAIIDRYLDCSLTTAIGDIASVGTEGLALYPAGFSGMGMQCVSGEHVWYQHTKENVRQRTGSFVLPGDRERYIKALTDVRAAAFDRVVQEHHKVSNRTFEECLQLSIDTIVANARVLVEEINKHSGKIKRMDTIGTDPFYLNLHFDALKSASGWQESIKFDRFSATTEGAFNRIHLRWARRMAILVIPEVNGGEISYRVGNIFAVFSFFDAGTHNGFNVPLYRKWGPDMKKLSFSLTARDGEGELLRIGNYYKQLCQDAKTMALVMDHDYLAGVATQAVNEMSKLVDAVNAKPADTEKQPFTLTMARRGSDHDEVPVIAK